jgi:hypothetical protein
MVIRSRIVPLSLVAILASWLALLAAPASPEAVAAEGGRPRADKLLPEKTAVAITVADVPELAKRFLGTSIGRMSQDPQLQPYVKHVYGSVVEAVAKFQDRIELGLPEILSLPQGELTVAIVPQDQDRPALVILMDAKDQLPAAKRLLLKGGEQLDKAGAKKTEETVSGVKLTVYDGLGPRKQRRAAWFEKDTTIAVASSVEALKQVLAAWEGKEGARTLADNKKYAAILEHCRGGKDERPQLTWFVDPIALLRAAGQGNAGAQVAMVMALLPMLGLDGLSAVGGSMAFDAGAFDSILHFHAFLENPRSGVLDVVAFEPCDSQPERWVPGDVGTYVTFRWNYQRSFKTLTKLVDSIRGEGALAQEIENRISKPTGVDLVKEVLPLLDGRMSYITRIERPVTVQSQGILLGAKLKDPAEFAKVLEKAFTKFEANLTVGTSGGHRYYQARPRESKPDAAGPPQPAPCFGIVDDYFLIASRTELYQKALATRDDPSTGLADSLEFKLVASKIARRSGAAKPALFRFDRPEEGMRFLYEMAFSESGREGLKRRAERGDGFARTLQGALEAQPLPPFSVLQRYLAPSGAMLIDDETGWHYVAFTLRRK